MSRDTYARSSCSPMSRPNEIWFTIRLLRELRREHDDLGRLLGAEHVRVDHQVVVRGKLLFNTIEGTQVVRTSLVALENEARRIRVGHSLGLDEPHGPPLGRGRH